jgi:hypothetical protein
MGIGAGLRGKSEIFGTWISAVGIEARQEEKRRFSDFGALPSVEVAARRRTV